MLFNYIIVNFSLFICSKNMKGCSAGLSTRIWLLFCLFFFLAIRKSAGMSFTLTVKCSRVSGTAYFELLNSIKELHMMQDLKCGLFCRHTRNVGTWICRDHETGNTRCIMHLCLNQALIAYSSHCKHQKQRVNK